MANYFKPYRFGAIVSIAAGMLLTSGCRTASVNTPSRNLPYGSTGPLPFFRSFERNPRNTEDTNETPVPPDILPVPGYSEPALPPGPPVPPAPSAQKTRKSWLNSARRFPGSNPKTTTVDQTNVESQILGVPSSLSDAESISPLPPEMPPLHSEAPGSLPSIPELSSTRSANNALIPQAATTQSQDVDSSSSYELSPIRTRRGTINPWPYAKRSGASRSNSNVPGEATSNSTFVAPATGQRSTPVVGDVPFLLPPSP